MSKTAWSEQFPILNDPLRGYTQSLAFFKHLVSSMEIEIEAILGPDGPRVWG